MTNTRDVSTRSESVLVMDAHEQTLVRKIDAFILSYCCLMVRYTVTVHSHMPTRPAVLYQLCVSSPHPPAPLRHVRQILTGPM